MVTSNASAVPASSTRTNQRRKLSPQAGQALEKLSHAIEYLTDEYIHENGPMSANDASIKAVQLLMSLNRQVYMECPIVPSFSERCRSFVHSCLT
jgi:hypothetical protein